MQDVEYLCIKSELKDDYNRRINIINKKLSYSEDPNLKLLNDIFLANFSMS